jgi:hypothetical protein
MGFNSNRIVDKIDLLIPDDEELTTYERTQLEKEFIFDEVMYETRRGKEFSVNALISSIALIIVALFVFGIKIHFNNRIYDLSRDINYLSDEKERLFEENIALRMKLEKEKFFNDIESEIF